MDIRKSLRRLLGIDFPRPAVGQQFRSRNSGRVIEVMGVEITDEGSTRTRVTTLENKTRCHLHETHQDLVGWVLRLRRGRFEQVIEMEAASDSYPHP